MMGWGSRGCSTGERETEGGAGEAVMRRTQTTNQPRPERSLTPPVSYLAPARHAPRR